MKHFNVISTTSANKGHEEEKGCFVPSASLKGSVEKRSLILQNLTASGKFNLSLQIQRKIDKMAKKRDLGAYLKLN